MSRASKKSLTRTISKSQFPDLSKRTSEPINLVYPSSNNELHPKVEHNTAANSEELINNIFNN